MFWHLKNPLPQTILQVKTKYPFYEEKFTPLWQPLGRVVEHEGDLTCATCCGILYSRQRASFGKSLACKTWGFHFIYMTPSAEIMQAYTCL